MSLKDRYINLVLERSEGDIDGLTTVGPPTKVYRRKKKGNKGIIEYEYSVREGVEGPNRTDSCHEGIGNEDARNHEGEHGDEEHGGQ